jgi:ferredoxin, 2Fe-2S
MPKVTFRALDKTVEIPDGATVFDAGAQVHAMIETACVGKGTCGLCRVKVLEGEAFLPAYTDEELKHLGNVYHITKVRLSCRLQVRGGDVVVDLAPSRRKNRG